MTRTIPICNCALAHSRAPFHEERICKRLMAARQPGERRRRRFFLLLSSSSSGVEDAKTAVLVDDTSAESQARATVTEVGGVWEREEAEEDLLRGVVEVDRSRLGMPWWKQQTETAFLPAAGALSTCLLPSSSSCESFSIAWGGGRGCCCDSCRSFVSTAVS
jgi:hypothetical protein